MTYDLLCYDCTRLIWPKVTTLCEPSNWEGFFSLQSNFDGGLYVKTTCKIRCPNRMGITGEGTRIVRTTYRDKVCLLAINTNGERNEMTGRIKE